MTDHTPAPAMQEAVRDAIRKAYDDGYNDAKMAPDNCSTYCVERAVRLDSAALLSKLRAPVADERAAFEDWLLTSNVKAHIGYSTDELTLARAAWDERARRAALASAPVAGEALNLVTPHDWAGSDEEYAAAVGRGEVRAFHRFGATDAAPQASEAPAAEALEIARGALMEIADLADVDADDRSVIVNQALTKIARMTAAPRADKEPQ